MHLFDNIDVQSGSSPKQYQYLSDLHTKMSLYYILINIAKRNRKFNQRASITEQAKVTQDQASDQDLTVEVE